MFFSQKGHLLATQKITHPQARARLTQSVSRVESSGVWSSRVALIWHCCSKHQTNQTLLFKNSSWEVGSQARSARKLPRGFGIAFGNTGWKVGLPRKVLVQVPLCHSTHDGSFWVSENNKESANFVKPYNVVRQFWNFVSLVHQGTKASLPVLSWKGQVLVVQKTCAPQARAQLPQSVSRVEHFRG